MTQLKEIGDFKTELVDRFGELPKEARNLLFKIGLKILSKKAGIARLDLNGQQLHLHFSEAHMKKAESLVELILSAPERYKLQTGNVLDVKLAGYRGGGHLERTKNILKEITQRVNN